MRRAAKVTLKFATASKRKAVAALLEAYRAAVNFYVASLWETPGRLDKETLARLGAGSTRLSARYKSQALKQALDTVVATKKAALGRSVSVPVYDGPLIADAKFVSVEDGNGSFDLVVRLSSLTSGRRIVIPTRHTAVTRKWLGKGGEMIQGACIDENKLVLWVGLPEQPAKEGRTIGIDIGYDRLVVTSDGAVADAGMKPVCLKLQRRKPGSRAFARAQAERVNVINRSLNLLPWDEIGVLGLEDLSDMKRGKRKTRGKTFRKAMSPWTYRQVLNRAKAKAEENRVRPQPVPPANTSRECPSCGAVDAENRKGEYFLCVICGHADNADTVGAQNVLARTLLSVGSLESPVPKRARNRNLLSA